jgi:hypothetical protein
MSIYFYVSTINTTFLTTSNVVFHILRRCDPKRPNLMRLQSPFLGKSAQIIRIKPVQLSGFGQGNQSAFVVTLVHSSQLTIDN